jgi:hypothetical protein
MRKPPQQSRILEGTGSVTTSWTAGASEHGKILQQCRDDSRVKAIPSANVCLASVYWRHHLPGAPVARQDDNIVLHHTRGAGEAPIL